ncbi:MAG: ABC transporter permease [Candidatus Latescibacterota bacterium]
MSAVLVLAWRELLGFVRQPARLVGSLLQPLLFWLLMGAGFARSFRSPGAAQADYAEFFYPGVVLMLLLFAAIFSTITLIEDRHAGFLQGVLVAPVSRLGVVMGKVLGGTGIAVLQAALFLALAPLAGIPLSVAGVVQLLLVFALVGVGFTGLGFGVAWLMESVSGYHAVMSVVMIPLWVLSGALFPREAAAGWLQWVMRANPVTYSMEVIRRAFYAGPAALVGDTGFVQALAVTAAWALLTLVGCVALASRGSRA